MESFDIKNVDNLRDALAAIAHDKRFVDADVKEVAQYIGELAASVLNCRRVGTWHYQSAPIEQIVCIDRWDQISQQHESGAVLGIAEASSYLGALEKESLMIIDDAMTDPRCVELATAYLPEHKITSMLDAPFQYDGKLAGVLCFEHVGKARKWSKEEQQFSMAMASLLSIATERSNRQLAENLREEERSRYRQLVEGMPDGVVIVVDGIIIFANDSVVKMAGLSEKSELIGQTSAKYFPEDEKNIARNREKQILQSHVVLPVVEYTAIRADGSVLLLELTSQYVSWEGKDAVQSILRDVTRQVTAREALARSEALLAEAEEIAQMGTWKRVLPDDSMICSQGMYYLLGINTADEMTLPVFLEKIHGEDSALVIDTIKQCESNSLPYEIAYRLQVSGKEVWVEERGKAIKDLNGNVVALAASCRDITKQKSAELDFIESENQLLNLVNSFPGGFTYSDIEQRYVFVNENFSNWIGESAKSMVGQTIREFSGEKIHGEIADYIDMALNGEGVTFERHSIYPNGTEKDVQISYVPDFDREGVVRGFFSLITDISHQKQIEKALLQAQKMEAVGQLTGGIAHDFNNILTIVLGNLEIAEKYLPLESKLSEYITAAKTGAERGTKLTSRLLSFSGTNASDESLLDVNQSISNMRKLISQSLTASIEVNLELNPEIPNIFANAGDFEHALLNLALNAKDAMGSGGVLTISTHYLDLSSDTLPKTVVSSENWRTKNRYIELRVQDTGQGIENELKERIFEPFFTTKIKDKGTGLGLSIVYGFVNRAGGAIEIESALGQGSCFRVFLPAAAEKLETKIGASTEIDQLPRGTETILVVDDETALVILASRNLESLGYQVKKANSAKRALEVLAETKSVDLLFSDVIMPEMNGYQLVIAAQLLQPNLRILMTSGFDKVSVDSAVEQEQIAALDNLLLSKPYNRAELAHYIRQVLDE